MFTTGIKASDQLIGVSFNGNIIPQIWYKVFLKKDLKSPKPHLLAINILSDIVFWYRPREERDETTGAIVGYSKRFSSDLLQRSYEQIAELFGCSKGQATDAIIFLEKMGVVERVFRTRNINGVVCNNILYIALNVERLKELTYPHSENAAPEVSRNFGTGVAEFQEGCQEISREGVAKFQETNTEITTKITPQNTPSIHPACVSADTCESSTVIYGLNEDELREIVEEDFLRGKVIPYHYRADERKMLAAVRTLTDWYELTPAHFRTDFERVVFDMLVDCLADMASAESNQTYMGSVVTYAKIIDQINAVVQRDGSLYEFAEQTVDDYINAATVTEIKDKRKYMKAVIWNSFSTYRVKFESDFARTFIHS